MMGCIQHAGKLTQNCFLLAKHALISLMPEIKNSFIIKFSNHVFTTNTMVKTIGFVFTMI